MQIAKLSIQYDRGLAHNDERDLTQTADGGKGGFINRRGSKTADGKVIRGLGTHYRSEADAVLVAQRDQEARRIYQLFRSRFLATPLDGVYVISKRGEAKAFIDGTGYRSDMKVFVTEFELTAPGELNTDELRAWGTKIQRQLASISLGRSKEADEEGLRSLEYLATCPILKKQTGTRIKELVAQLREGTMTRIEVKRHLDTLPVEIEQTPLAPRQSPKIAAEVA